MIKIRTISAFFLTCTIIMLLICIIILHARIKTHENILLIQSRVMRNMAEGISRCNVVIGEVINKLEPKNNTVVWSTKDSFTKDSFTRSE